MRPRADGAGGPAPIAVVTGASRGIGLAVARRLAEAGWRTAAVARDPARLDAAVADAAERGLRLEPCPADVTSEQSVAALFDRLRALGPVQVCVNCAGVNLSMPLIRTGPGAGSATPGGEPLEHPLAEWERIIRLCLTGVFLMGRQAAAAMVAAAVPGVIVNISSAVRRGARGQSAYTAAKSGVDALTRTWSLELARHDIRVVGVAPGVVDGAALREKAAADPRHAARMERLRTRIPLRRWACEDEVADAVCFAVANDYVTGTVLEVHGGGVPDH